jgi:dephospho-CoA kinase
MLIIGLTGGIGAGKTMVSNIFKTLRVPIYNSDNRAKYLMTNNNDLRKSLCYTFSNKVFNKNILNTNFLSNIVFNNALELQKLNNLVHPFVIRDFESWISKQKSKFVIKEAAILIESGAYKKVDKIILVIADKEIRIDRIKNRDNINKEAILSRIDKQISDKERMQYADFVIDNNENKSIINQVKNIYNEIRDELLIE